MIAVFPESYPDELVYSVFSRYFAMSGYRLYRSAAEDILRDPHSRPDVLFRGIAICPKHACRLVESDALIGSGSPRFVSAEEQVPDDSPVAMCRSETEVRLARCVSQYG